MQSKSKKIRMFEYISCKRKKQHSTLREGLNHLIKDIDDGYDNDSVYKCLFGDHYHIGHYKMKKTRYRVKQIFKLIGEK